MDGSVDRNEEKECSLYGGAMSTCLPRRLVDWSDYRPVPDHQEVYTDLEQGQCVVIELTEMQDSLPEESLRTYYRDALELNEAKDSLLMQLESLSVPRGLEHASHVGMLKGRYVASESKGRGVEDHLVLYHLILIRVPIASTDLFVGLHTPFRGGISIDADGKRGSYLRIEGEAIEQIDRCATELILRCLRTWNLEDLDLFRIPSA